MIVKGTRHGALRLISSPNRLMPGSQSGITNQPESAAYFTKPEPVPNLPITWRLANTMYYADRGYFDCAAMWDGPIA